jgi:hypothetical protein
MVFAMSAAALTVLSMALGILVHGVLLGPGYAATGLFRTEADGQAHIGFMILAHVLIGVGMTWIYRQGRQPRPKLGQGVRFGLAVSVMMVIPMYLIYYAVQPMPPGLVARQIVYSVIGTVIMGVVAAWINQRDIASVT